MLQHSSTHMIHLRHHSCCHYWYHFECQHCYQFCDCVLFCSTCGMNCVASSWNIWSILLWSLSCSMLVSISQLGVFFLETLCQCLVWHFLCSQVPLVGDCDSLKKLWDSNQFNSLFSLCDEKNVKKSWSVFDFSFREFEPHVQRVRRMSGRNVNCGNRLFWIHRQRKKKRETNAKGRTNENTTTSNKGSKEVSGSY